MRRASGHLRAVVTATGVIVLHAMAYMTEGGALITKWKRETGTSLWCLFSFLIVPPAFALAIFLNQSNVH